MKLAARRSLIDSSGIRKVFDLAAKMKNPINLSIGQPDFDVPDLVKESCISAIRGGKNKYTLTAGIPRLREALAKRYTDRGVPFGDVIVTSGTSGALQLIFMMLLDPGDEVLITDPYFVIYKSMIEFLGGKPVLIDTYPDFRLTREKLEAATTPRTKLLIINTPSNPTGIVFSDAECRMIAEFADSRGIAVMTDEIYEPFVFDGEFVSPAKYLKEPIVVSGLSKSVGMTGWRVGWCVGPKNLIQAMTDLQQYTFVCAPSMPQEAALEALEYDITPMRDEYHRRRDLIYNGLIDAGFRVSKPNGAFYIFPEAPNGDGQKFVMEAIENEVLIVPGNVFSARNTHFRISFASSQQTLRAGLDVLGRLAEKHLAAK